MGEKLDTVHPLAKDGYKFVFHTPKYRHGAHTMPIDTDMVAMLFGPFGDIYRHDKRRRSLPRATSTSIPETPKRWASRTATTSGSIRSRDRPFRGWQQNAKDYKFARLICRARYYPGTPRGVTRMWFNMYGATPGSVEGRETRADGLAKNPRTNYQAMFRSGSHQSATRGWLKPTWMTDRWCAKTCSANPQQGVHARRALPDRRAARSDGEDHQGRAGWYRRQGTVAPRGTRPAAHLREPDDERYLGESILGVTGRRRARRANGPRP